MMTISTKGRYGLRMILDLAAHQEDGYISLKEISARQSVSKKYLEQIVPVYTASGILRTVRGPQGGYMLAESPSSYTVGDILRLTEGDLAPVPCAGQDPAECERAEGCMTASVWKGLNQVITDYLDGMTLQDILDRYSGEAGSNYVI